MLEVRPLDHPTRFLDLQRRFYRGDPNFVPPLTSAETWMVDRRRNSWFDHGEASFLVAYRDGQPAGRISAARDRFHDELWNDRIGFFGHFEADGEDAAGALLDHAREWLREHGATAMRGPIDLSTNYKCGLLIGGEPGPPVLGMAYNPPHYANWLESWGLAGVKDLLALRMLETRADMSRMERVIEKLRRRTGVTTRAADFRRMDHELEVVWQLYNDIWERNWGFVKMSKGEFMASAKDLKRIAVPEMIRFAERQGETVGIATNVPDINRGILACNGRLLPFGWWKFLRALKRTQSTRMLTLGVRKDVRKTGADAILLYDCVRATLASGYFETEASWILEDNVAMIRPLEAMGGYEYRRYRLYERAVE